MSLNLRSRLSSAQRRSIAGCLVGLLAFGNTGCSLLFVKGPPQHKPAGISASAVDCTSSKVAPVFDTIFTGLEVVRTAYAASAPDSVYRDPKQPLSRGADIGLGLGFTALFLGSAIYGYSATSKCAKYQRLGVEDEMDEERGDELPTVREEPRRASPSTDGPAPAAEPTPEPAPTPAAAPVAPPDSEAPPATPTEGG